MPHDSWALPVVIPQRHPQALADEPFESFFFFQKEKRSIYTLFVT